ncbi:hypothetical protein BS17DRAFT_193568 [Gyrodon lividus]|nr:hypothetical protein BS17DRAFT_193568 [Gyrodon lividus]
MYGSFFNYGNESQMKKCFVKFRDILSRRGRGGEAERRRRQGAFTATLLIGTRGLKWPASEPMQQPGRSKVIQGAEAERAEEPQPAATPPELTAKDKGPQKESERNPALQKTPTVFPFLLPNFNLPLLQPIPNTESIESVKPSRHDRSTAKAQDCLVAHAKLPETCQRGAASSSLDYHNNRLSSRSLSHPQLSMATHGKFTQLPQIETGANCTDSSRRSVGSTVKLISRQ